MFQSNFDILTPFSGAQTGDLINTLNRLLYRKHGQATDKSKRLANQIRHQIKDRVALSKQDQSFKQLLIVPHTFPKSAGKILLETNEIKKEAIDLFLIEEKAVTNHNESYDVYYNQEYFNRHYYLYYHKVSDEIFLLEEKNAKKGYSLKDMWRLKDKKISQCMESLKTALKKDKDNKMTGEMLRQSVSNTDQFNDILGPLKINYFLYKEWNKIRWCHAGDCLLAKQHAQRLPNKPNEKSVLSRSVENIDDIGPVSNNIDEKIVVAPNLSEVLDRLSNSRAVLRAPYLSLKPFPKPFYKNPYFWWGVTGVVGAGGGIAFSSFSIGVAIAGVTVVLGLGPAGILGACALGLLYGIGRLITWALTPKASENRSPSRQVEKHSPVLFEIVSDSCKQNSPRNNPYHSRDLNAREIEEEIEEENDERLTLLPNSLENPSTISVRNNIEKAEKDELLEETCATDNTDGPPTTGHPVV